MKKNFFIILLFAIILSNVQAIDLTDYPEVFEGKDIKIVISPNANIVSKGLAASIRKDLSGSQMVSPEDIENITEDLILIGNACENPLVDEIRRYPENCRADLTRGAGRAEILDYKGHTILIFEGYDQYGLYAIEKSLYKGLERGTSFKASIEDNISTYKIGEVLLRKNRLNHLIDEYGQIHTFKFVNRDDMNHPIIEIDGNILEPNNDICYISDRSSVSIQNMYTTIKVSYCKKQKDVIEEKDKSTNSTGNELIILQNDAASNKKSFLFDIFEWFIGLFK